jgi:hypothetical protein
MVLGDFSTPLPPIDESSRQKLYRETLELNDTIEQMDLKDTCRVFHSE